MRLMIMLNLMIIAPQMAWAVSADELVQVAPARLEQLLVQRQPVLERLSSIDCDPVTPAVIAFGIAPDVHPAQTYGFGARYIPPSRSFLFNPKFYAALNRWHGDEPEQLASFLIAEEKLRMTIDHELGHALVHDIARRSGQLDWYNGSFMTWASDAQIGLKILSEGLGTYFERLTSDDRNPHGRSIMPSNWQDPNWSSRFDEICYESGYSVVADIVDQYGERGIVYILAHPLLIPDGDLYGAATEYTRIALEVLGTEVR